MTKKTLNFDEMEIIKNTQFKYVNQLPSRYSTQYQNISSMLIGFFKLCDELPYNFHLFPAASAFNRIMIDKTELAFPCEKYLILKDKSYPYVVNELLSQYKKYFSYLERNANGRDIIFNIGVPFVFESDNVYLYGYYMFLDKDSFNRVWMTSK